ncbi:MAG: hypothetical protein ABH817_00880 [archaeon]
MVFKKIWNFLWKSNSILSWIVDIILIFLIVKFIIFPILALIFATPVPFVIVESSSMSHQILKDSSGRWMLCGQEFETKEKVDFDKYWDTCGKWYEDEGITKQEVLDYWDYLNGFEKGDIMIIYGGKKEYKKGEVIVFKVPSQSTPIIHRIVETNGTVWQTKGDHNSGQIIEYEDLFGRTVAKGSFGSIKQKDETEINSNEILGKAIGRIKYLGWVKLVFVELFS